MDVAIPQKSGLLEGDAGDGKHRDHHLQILVGEVVVADDRVAVSPDRNRRVVADVAGRFERAVDGADNEAERTSQDRVSAPPPTVVDRNLSCGTRQFIQRVQRRNVSGVRGDVSVVCG